MIPLILVSLSKLPRHHHLQLSAPPGPGPGLRFTNHHLINIKLLPSTSALPSTSSSSPPSQPSRSPPRFRTLHTSQYLKMRLPYTLNPPPASDPETASIISRIQARRSPRPLQALDLTLLHSPPVADGWNSFLGAIRTKTSLEDDVREVAICRVAVCNKAWYEWAHHAPLAKAGGVSEEGMKTLRMDTVEEEGAGLSDRLLMVVRYSDAMTRSVSVPEAIFDGLKSYFTDKEIVEITATVAAYNCVSRFLVALDVGEKNATHPANDAH